VESSELEGIYRPGKSRKRQAEVLERLRWGETPKRIATDLGISRGAVEEIIEVLKESGQVEAGPPAGE
jgi:DNA-binding NarL/FixJ family response regulator